MLVMLCTRCQQREAEPFTSPPETRAMFEAEFGMPWPFPDDLCRACRQEWMKSPEAKATLEPIRRAMKERMTKRLEKLKDEVRAKVLEVLDVADAIAGKL